MGTLYIKMLSITNGRENASQNYRYHITRYNVCYENPRNNGVKDKGKGTPCALC